MSEKAIHEPDAKMVTDSVFDQTGNEQNFWKFCTDVFVSKPEVTQMTLIYHIFVSIKFIGRTNRLVLTEIWFSEF